MTAASDYFLANCKFAYRCMKTWESLQRTSKEDTRYCTECHEEVYYCKTKREIVHALRHRKCIAIYEHEGIFESHLMGQIIPK